MIVKQINKYMGLIILAVSAIGFFFPKTTSWVIPHIPTMLGIIMFGMGLTIEKKDFENVLKKPYHIFIGSFLQFTIMPILAYLLATVFRLPKDLAIGVILVGSVSGGTASNVITYLAKGDVPLSVSMTTVSTILGAFITPILVYFLGGKWINVSIVAMFITILKIIIVPVTLGVLVSYFFSGFVKKYITVMPVFSIFAIALTCGAIIGQNAKQIISSGLIIVLVVMIHNLLGLFIAYIVSKALKLPQKEILAVTIEVGTQNSGLASSLAIAHFSPISAVPGAIFSVWHNISGTIFANYWRGKIKDDNTESNKLEENKK